MKRLRGGMAVALTIAGLTVSGGVADGGRETPAAPENGKGALVRSRDKVPEGARFPICWAFEFQKPEAIKVGQKVEVVVRVTALLFDLADVELIPAAGGDITLSAGEEWKGTLKKGEPREMKMTLAAGVDGDNGPYGVTIKVPGFYEAVRAYAKAQTEGPYADPAAKSSVMEQVDGMQEEMPEYETWAGSTLVAGEKKGGQ